ncbi:MAG: response regulator [Thermodesulfobacteriota bacterium]
MTADRGTPRATILVVDDDEAHRYAKVHTLRRAGFEVHEAARGMDALRLIAERPPRLVVLDVNLPDLSGWEVCRRLKREPETATIPVLQMSASYVTEADTVRALEGGADACLTEPIEPPVLIATVRALLRARRAEEELRDALAREQAARAAAEAASRTKDDFLATLSHELRSPLNAILSWVRLARTDRLDTEKQKHALEVIERNTRLQMRLIEELLDVSRIVSGKMRLELELVDVAPLVHTALESIRPLAEEKEIVVGTAIDPRVAPIAADAYRVQQVFVNLLSNAVKFTPPGGRVDVAVRDEDSHTVISIKDTGRGIAPAFLPHIFERFRQGDASTTRGAGGLGLGLAIVRHLVDLHGGSVAAESAGVDKGSTFTVHLPIAKAHTGRTQGAHAIALPRTSTEAPDLSGLRILLVDDEADAREAISFALQQYGARVRQSASVEQAIRLLEAEPPDMIISDIAMPGEDGYALVQRIRESSNADVGRLPIIALTAYSSLDDRQRIAKAGFDLQLAKPVEPGHLAAAVGRLVQRTRGA